LYGRRITNKEVLMGAVKAPSSAAPLIATLNRYSRVEEGGTADRKR
jgi:lipid-binding SYLF domain-containing protein